MRLFFLSLVIAVSVTACAPPPGAAVAAPPHPALQARADSLLALPPDSLSTADTAWLQEHARQHAPENAAARQRGRVIGGAVAGVGVGLFVLFAIVISSISLQ